MIMTDISLRDYALFSPSFSGFTNFHGSYLDVSTNWVNYALNL